MMKVWMLSVWIAMALVLGGSERVQAQPNPLQGPQTITVVDAGACATAGACASFSLNNFTVGALEVSGTFTGTLTPEVLVNTVWVPVTLYDGTGAPFTAITVPGAFSVANTGFARVRLRAGVFASGTATVYMRQGYFMAKLPGTGSRILSGGGTAVAPAYSSAANPNAGMYFISAQPAFSAGGVGYMEVGSDFMQLKSTTALTWSVGNINNANDTGLSRTNVGQISFGNGTPGDTSGTWIAAAGTINSNLAMGAGARIFWSGRAQITSPSDGNFVVNNAALTIGSVFKADALPTVFSGFGTSPSVTAGSTPLAGSVNIGTGGVATGGVIAFNGTAFPAAPFCMVTNATVTTVTIMTAVATTTQLTINADRVIPASSLIAWHCISPK